MFGLERMREIEARGSQIRPTAANGAGGASPGAGIAILFVLVVVGILANWFWGVGWDYIAKPTGGIAFGDLLTILVRVVLAFIAAALIFVPTYNKIGQSSSESWVPYTLAFQNGFFWHAAFDAITRQFGGG